MFQINESFDIYCYYIALYVEVCNISTKMSLLKTFFYKGFRKGKPVRNSGTQSHGPMANSMVAGLPKRCKRVYLFLGVALFF